MIHFIKLTALIVSTQLMLQIGACKSQDTTTTLTQDVVLANDWSTEIPDVIEPIEKSAAEWKSELSKMEYYVLREKGTERAFTGDLLKEKRDGIYVCRGCGLPLFASDTKYKSGTGWPSYYQPIEEKVIGENTDYDLGYPRTEVHCARCDGHLGHVFPDGPKPTGLRYCINAVSMDFMAK